LNVLRFGLVGVVNTAVDFAIFVLLYRWAGLDPLLANGMAFVLAVTNSYLLNHRWTFRRHNRALSFSGYARFVALNSGGLLIGTLAILLLGRLMPLEFAKLIAAGLTLLWNFTTSKLFVFNPGEP
jgi:putative flippase GtrA